MGIVWEPELDAEASHWQSVARDLTRSHFAELSVELDRDQRYATENIRELVHSGLAGLFLPPDYGGRGATLTATVAAVEAVGAGCSSTAAILCTYQLGAFPILLGGNEAQRQQYLRGMVQGRATAFALSERGAGSDPAMMTTRAAREGQGWRLSGEKYWIGNGGAADHYIVFAKSGTEGERGISAFIVDKDAAGVEIDEYSDKMGLRGTQTSNLRLDTFVSDDRRVGEVGRALSLALKTLNVGRIMVAAQSTGLALAAYEEASRQAALRTTFGQPIIEHQGIGFRLADVATELSAARMMLYEAARHFDRGGDITVLGAMAKLFSSEVAHRAADVAVQVWGGAGYCKPNLPERLYRDQRILEIYEGTSEIQRVVLSRAIQRQVGSATEI